MMRHRLSRILIGELLGSTRREKLVLLLPFVVLIFDLLIFHYSIVNREFSIIISSGFVLALSVLEIIAALGEINERLACAKKHSSLESMVTEVAKQFDYEPTVRQVVEKMSYEHPEEKFSRYELYPVVCNVLNDIFPVKKKKR
jgi:sensor histidine kinase regulating citrate/malate metabolism